MSSGKVVLLTGDIETGKTSLCLDIAHAAKKRGLEVAGIASPAVFEGDIKIAIDAKDLRTGNCRRLAVLQDDIKTGLETRRWSFNLDVISWGNQILKEAIPCDLLIVDELGPLEFNRHEGWVAGFSSIESRDYQVAVVVIRPSLLKTAKQRWKIFQEIDINSPDKLSLTGENIITTLGL